MTDNSLVRLMARDRARREGRKIYDEHGSRLVYEEMLVDPSQPSTFGVAGDGSEKTHEDRRDQ